MSMVFESDQVGKRQSWANIIANIESEATPYSSMVQKRQRPAQVLQSWQVKSYPITGHSGVVDGQDATSFDANPRGLIQCNGQKTWRKPGVSDFAEEAEIVALDKGEMAEQIADALVTVKRQIEKRCLSAYDTANDNGTTQGNETRGVFVWCQNTAQTLYPVPTQWRTPSAQIYTSGLSSFTETTYLGLCRSSFKQRNGAFRMHAFLGIDLKDAFTNFSKYLDNVSGKTPVRQFLQEASSEQVIISIDKLVLDTGEVDLHPVTFLQTNAIDGTATANTHISGIQLDMDMAGLAYTRMPRVVKLPYLGGGQKAIVDAIFLNMIDNPLGAIVMNNAS